MSTGFRIFNNRQPKRGFILITVLLITALLLSTVGALAVFSRSEVRRIRDAEFSFRARSVALVASKSASSWIAADDNEYDSPLEKLYSVKKPRALRFGDVTVKVRITPLDDKIPIRHLFLPDGTTLAEEYRWSWDLVWQILERPELANVILDYMDKNTEIRLGSKEEDFYINRMITDLSEWLRVPGVTWDVLYGSGDVTGGADRYFSVFSGSKININTVKPEVLLVLDKDFNSGNVGALLQSREESPIKSIEGLRKTPSFPPAVATRLINVIGFKSDFFRVDLEVAEFSNRRYFTIIMKRSGQKECEVVRWEE